MKLQGIISLPDATLCDKIYSVVNFKPFFMTKNPKMLQALDKQNKNLLSADGNIFFTIVLNCNFSHPLSLAR